MSPIVVVCAVLGAFAVTVWKFPDWNGSKRLDNRTVVAIVLAAILGVLAFLFMPHLA